MDTVTFKNNRGESFGIANGIAFLAKSDVELDGDLSDAALRRANAETFRCEELHEARLHEDAARSVTLVKKNGVRPTDISTIEVRTDDEAVQRDFVAAVVQKMRPTTESRTSSLATEVVGPLIVGAFVAILGGVVVSVALDMANGAHQPSGRLGKAGAIARLAGTIAGALGTTGSIAVFGILLLLCVAWLVSVIRRRHAVIRWRVS